MRPSNILKLFGSRSNNTPAGEIKIGRGFLSSGNNLHLIPIFLTILLHLRVLPTPDHRITVSNEFADIFRIVPDFQHFQAVAAAEDIILVPERPLSWADAANRLAANKLRGQLTSIVMIAEGAGKAEDFCEYVRKYTDVEIKATVLGYIQRGGNPSAFDRVLAAKMGQRAVELLADEANMRGTDRAGSRAAENNDLRENFGYAVGIRENRIISVPLAEAVSTRDCFDDKLYDLNSVMAKF